MRYSIAIIAALILVATALSLAKPFLVSDPQVGVEKYIVVLKGDTTWINPQKVSLDSVRVWFDLDGIESGNIEVAAEDSFGFRSRFVPFTLGPARPTGLRVEE